MTREPTREDVDFGVRRAQERGRGTAAWKTWAERWLLRLDPRAEAAVVAFDQDLDLAGPASAAAAAVVSFLEMGALPNGKARMDAAKEVWELLAHLGVDERTWLLERKPSKARSPWA